MPAQWWVGAWRGTICHCNCDGEGGRNSECPQLPETREKTNAAQLKPVSHFSKLDARKRTGWGRLLTSNKDTSNHVSDQRWEIGRGQFGPQNNLTRTHWHLMFFRFWVFELANLWGAAVAMPDKPRQRRPNKCAAEDGRVEGGEAGLHHQVRQPAAAWNGQQEQDLGPLWKNNRLKKTRQQGFS